MKISKISQSLLLVSLSAFFYTGAYAADVSPEQAFESLTPSALVKLKEAKIDVNALLNNESNDLIVNFSPERYQVDNSDNTGKSVATRRFKAVKEKVASQLTDSVLLRDYYGSPVSFYRVQSLADLITLLNSQDVESVQPNVQLEPMLTESLKHINQPQTASAYLETNSGKHYFKGEGSVIAILDTGLDAYHSDFGNCSYSRTDCSVIDVLEFAEDGNGKVDGNLEDSDSKHGTNVSAIAHGVAPEAKLIGLDVFGWQYNPSSRKYEHRAPTYAINAALNWIYNNHISKNANGLNVVSLNMSLGGGYEQRATNTMPIFGDLKALGVASVVASGNEFYTDAIAWPASETNAIAVGAVHDTAKPYAVVDCGSYGVKSGIKVDDVTCFSNSGSLLDILAPGYDITGGGVTLSGTSMASPHVAGAYAVLRSPDAIRFTGDTVDDTTYRLKNGGVSVTDFRNGLTRPRLDLFGSLMTLNES